MARKKGGVLRELFFDKPKAKKEFETFKKSDFATRLAEATDLDLDEFDEQGDFLDSADRIMESAKTRLDVAVKEKSLKGKTKLTSEANVPQPAFLGGGTRIQEVGTPGRLGAEGGIEAVKARREVPEDSPLAEAETPQETRALEKTGEKEQRALSTEDRKLVFELRKEFSGNPVVKDTLEIKQSVSRLDNVARAWLTDPKGKQSKLALDQALVVGFNKLLDPGSVVRESEFARTPQGQSLINKFKSTIQKIETGGVGLTDPDRLELINTAKQLLGGQINAFNDVKTFYEEEAGAVGAPPERVAIPLGDITRLIEPLSLRESITGEDIQSFNSVKEANAANLPKGTIITIGGRRAEIT